MKASDYIVEYLIDKGITDVFGYPGGMVTHLMDSFSKRQFDISAHVSYHEQGAAFEACGYAQASGKVGVAYATSGPGATNLITGICDAYFDSIPVLFITGQVNTFESKGAYSVRQRGFQETDIVSMVKDVTKYAKYVDKAENIKEYLDEAFAQATTGRKGPVLLDIPMNIFRSDIEIPIQKKSKETEKYLGELGIITKMLYKSKRPCILIGNGIKQVGITQYAGKVLKKLNIPVVTTMLAIDIFQDQDLNYGFIGAYGNRAANFVVAKSDLVITIGARLDVRQVGAKRENFAPNAKIIRIDVDEGELQYKVHSDELSIVSEIKPVLDYLDKSSSDKYDFKEWISVCKTIKQKLANLGRLYPNNLVKELSNWIPEDTIITTDVGQNQVWVAQSLKVKKGQRIFFSGGHGAMGYSLPAAIGCACATGQNVYCITGDGGFQMNVQELEFIEREKLPVKVIVFNNYALGMIRHFQEMYFECNYTQTIASQGYTVPNLEKVAKAYEMKYFSITSENDFKNEMFFEGEACLIEVKIKENTYVFPKLEFGKPNQDQEPLLDRKLYNELMEL